jgi:hypothetical protein
MSLKHSIFFLSKTCLGLAKKLEWWSACLKCVKPLAVIPIPHKKIISINGKVKPYLLISGNLI